MNYMKNPHPYWSSHPIYTPRFLFFPLFAKVIMLWCGHVPTDALVFRSVALFTKMCSAIQFHFHVFTRELGGAEGKWSSGAHPVSPTAFISCVYISLIPVSTFLFPLLNIEWLCISLAVVIWNNFASPHLTCTLLLEIREGCPRLVLKCVLMHALISKLLFNSWSGSTNWWKPANLHWKMQYCYGRSDKR